MKIIGRSNLDFNTVDDILVAENIKNEGYAKTMLLIMNQIHCDMHSTYYFQLVPDDYVLHKWVS